MPYNLTKEKKTCWVVQNTETGKIHSKCTTKKKAEAQIRLLESLENQSGEGILDEAKKLYEKILPQRKAGVLRPKSRKLLESIAKEPITSIEIVRTPIESYINNVLNAISLGAFKKAVQSLGYDRLFHLSLYINKKYVFHKIEVLTLDNAPKDLIQAGKSEVKPVPLLSTTEYTIGDMITKTREFMGEEKFTSYDPVRNNCQDLVLGVLKALNLNTSELENFVKQDAERIFSQIPSFVAKFAQGVTDIAGRFNRLVEGEGKGGFAIKIPEYNKKYLFPEMNKGGSTDLVNMEKIDSISADVKTKQQRGRPRKNPVNVEPVEKRPKGRPKVDKLAKPKTKTWIQALKEYNQNEKKWCVPKKGTAAYIKVLEIMRS